MAMWWYDAFYTLLPYFYILIDMQVFSFVILLILHTTGSCPESTDQTPAVVALGAVLVIVVLLLAPSHYWLVVHQ